jgi:hypothetical protein
MVGQSLLFFVSSPDDLLHGRNDLQFEIKIIDRMRVILKDFQRFSEFSVIFLNFFNVF